MKYIDDGNSNKPSLATMEFWEGSKASPTILLMFQKRDPLKDVQNPDLKIVGYNTSSLVERISEASTI